MKRNFLTYVTMFAMVVFFASCGGGSSEGGSDGETGSTEMNDDNTTTDTEAETDANKDVDAGNAELKPGIEGFVGMLDGTEEAAQKAIEAYGSEEVIANKMIPFGKDPKVTADEANEGCYTVELTQDGEQNVYYICMEGDKVISFDWKDMME